MENRAQPISSADRETKVRVHHPISGGHVSRKSWAQPISGGDRTRKAKIRPISGANRNRKARAPPPISSGGGEDDRTQPISSPDRDVRRASFSARREERLGRQQGTVIGGKNNVSERNVSTDRENNSQGRRGGNKKRRPPWGAGPGAASYAASHSTSRPTTSQCFPLGDGCSGGSTGGGGNGCGAGGEGGGDGGSTATVRGSAARRRRLASSSSGVGSPSNRRLPVRCSKAAAASLVSSSALKRFLPTWTSLAAEAVWLRGSRRRRGADTGTIDGGGGSGRHRSRSNGSEGIESDYTQGGCRRRRRRRSRRSAVSSNFEALTTSDSGCFREREDGCGGHRERGLRSTKGQAGEATSPPVAEEILHQASEAREETMARDRRGGGGGGSDGEGRGRGRGRGVPAPSLDPDVERKLMDWLRSRIDRCARVTIWLYKLTQCAFVVYQGIGAVRWDSRGVEAFVRAHARQEYYHKKRHLNRSHAFTVDHILDGKLPQEP